MASPVYLTPPKGDSTIYLVCGVRYTEDAIAKQMKSTTALKGTILQKTDQNLTLLSISMMNMKLKFF